MTWLLPVGLLTLFTAFKVQTGFVQLRPFDFVVVLMIFWTLMAGVTVKRRHLTGFLALMPFFLWHVLSAFLYGVENGLREGLQIALMTGFAAAIMLNIDRIDYRTAARLMIAGLVLVLAYNIVWHVSQGIWTGWKRLNNPKAVFGYLPMAVGCLVLFAAPAQRRFYWLVWAALLVVILLSGERKALLIYGIITAMLLARGRVLGALPFVGAGVIGLYVIINLFAAEDFTRQLRTLAAPLDAAGSADAVARGVTPDSLSNAQRTFAFNVASSYFSESPLIGFGTNSYQDLVRRQFAYLPGYMLLGVHGEFLRIAAENGLVGLVFYLLIWFIAIRRLRLVLRYFHRQGQITGVQAAVAPFVLLTSAFMYLALDASGTPSFAVLVVLSFLPDFAYGMLRQRAARAAMPGEPKEAPQRHFGIDRLAAG